MANRFYFLFLVLFLSSQYSFSQDRALHEWGISKDKIQETNDGFHFVLSSQKNETPVEVAIISRRYREEYDFYAKYWIIYEYDNKRLELAYTEVSGSDFEDSNISGNLNDRRVTIDFPNDLLNGNVRGRLKIHYEIWHEGRIYSKGDSHKTFGVMWDTEVNPVYPMPGEWWSRIYKIGRTDFTPVIDTVYYRNSIIRPGFQAMGSFTLKSPNGRYRLQYQADGNLVLTDLQVNKVLWDSGSWSKGGIRFNYQLDGNLVIYKVINVINGYDFVPIWASNTGLPTSALRYEHAKYSFYVLQDDGNFVMYYPKDFNTNKMHPIVETQTSGGKSSPHWKIIK